jgi:hypothetical protein
VWGEKKKNAISPTTLSNLGWILWKLWERFVKCACNLLKRLVRKKRGACLGIAKECFRSMKASKESLGCAEENREFLIANDEGKWLEESEKENNKSKAQPQRISTSTITRSAGQTKDKTNTPKAPYAPQHSIMNRRRQNSELCMSINDMIAGFGLSFGKCQSCTFWMIPG